MSTYHLVLHPWRSAPAGDLSIVLDADEPELHLAILAVDEVPEPGTEVEIEKRIGDFTLHKSPDDRVPQVAEVTARILTDEKPEWLVDRVLELLNNIHGFGTSRRPRGPAGKMGMDHPLAPLGLWGPSIDKVGREVRRGRLGSWEEVENRLDPMVTQSMGEALPVVLRDDILGVRTPRMLLREPL